MTILYSNGCSYTANNDVEQEFRYPLLIGKHFDWRVVDNAIPGCCNSIIIRRTMRDCINLLKQDEPIVALIQLTHKDRFEFAGNPTQETDWKYRIWNRPFDRSIDDHFESIRAEDVNSWPGEVKDYARQVVLTQKEDAINSNLLHGVVGLTSFFKTNNIRYLVYAGPSFKYERIAADPFYQYLLNDSSVLDLQNFDMLSVTNYPGKHPDDNSMKQIADYFIKLL